MFSVLTHRFLDEKRTAKPSVKIVTELEPIKEYYSAEVRRNATNWVYVLKKSYPCATRCVKVSDAIRYHQLVSNCDTYDNA